ncbi:MAG: PEP-CTERM sorting domain-containing protein [Pirellulales bacterium]
MKAIHCFAIAALCVFLGAIEAQAGVLYASTAAGAAGRLYVLNPATGAVVQDVGALNDVTGANYAVTGLAFNPLTGELFGSTGNANTAAKGTLVKINKATAQVTVVGAFNAGPTNTSGDPSTMADIGFDAAGNLYGTASIGGPNLYSINTTTGQATLVGANGVSTSTSGGGLAISAGGVVYGTPTSSRFGTYNSTTGAFTNIANPAKPTGGGAYGALDFDGPLLYGLNVGSGSPPPTALVTIDPATGTTTLVGNSVASLDAIAFYVPEPGTFLVLGMGTIALVMGRRR